MTKSKSAKKPKPSGGSGRKQGSASAFDYSRLSPEFSGLSKPAQRALINNGITTVKHLSRKTIDEVQSFHGMGPSSLPVLKAALKKHKMTFRAEKFAKTKSPQRMKSYASFAEWKRD